MTWCSNPNRRQRGIVGEDLQKKYGEPTPDIGWSAMRHIEILDRLDFQEFKVSLKASEIFMTVAAYRMIKAN